MFYFILGIILRIKLRKSEFERSFHIREVTFQKKTYLLDFNYSYCCLNYKTNNLHALENNAK